jgi:hypothetical protein
LIVSGSGKRPEIKKRSKQFEEWLYTLKLNNDIYRRGLQLKDTIVCKHLRITSTLLFHIDKAIIFEFANCHELVGCADQAERKGHFLQIN